jgi:hypothetical protein
MFLQEMLRNCGSISIGSLGPQSCLEPSIQRATLAPLSYLGTSSRQSLQTHYLCQLQRPHPAHRSPLFFSVFLRATPSRTDGAQQLLPDPVPRRSPARHPPTSPSTVISRATRTGAQIKRSQSNEGGKVGAAFTTRWGLLLQPSGGCLQTRGRCV